MYQQSGLSYLKFFKMDILSKVAYLASNMLLPKEMQEDKSKIAVVLSSTSGCLDVDKKFSQSSANIASPALFVYTLPNIMLGEICISTGFKGEQMCTLSDHADAGWFDFYVNDLLRNRGSLAVLCGHVEATKNGIEAVLCWINHQPGAIVFNEQNLDSLFIKRP